MKRLSVFGICIFLISSLQAQTGDLYENANAIVKERNAVFTQTDINNATYKVTEIITILNKQGEKFGYFTAYGDKFRELKDFQGVIRNAAGAEVKKINKKDLSISSLSESFKTDGYSIGYASKHPAYPYTVQYVYEFKFKNGILVYPKFDPVNNYRVAVEQANYTIELPSDTKVRYYSNFDCDIKERTGNNKHIYTFSAKNLKAIDGEPLSPVSRELFPTVSISPTDFCYDSKCGNMSDWNNYGKWVSALLEERDVLSQDIADKLKDIIKDAKTDKEKVGILYKYLQDNFRYVSIQLGIGGFQPIDAQTTMKNKFGDCKGLTNMMKAMLRVAGIESNYCEIYLGNLKYLYENFANVSQTNHAILLIPLQNDSIWLECTSSTLPFGYVHDKIAGHDALVITGNGGKLCRLPAYTSKQNRTESGMQINVSEDGTAKGNITFVEHLTGYDYARNYYNIMSNDRDKMVEYINANISMPKIQIGEINTGEDKSALPSCSLTLKYEAMDFAGKTGTRLFIPVCPLKKSSYNVFSATKRAFDIEINDGFSESDTIVIQIPESYIPESLPKDISLTTDFGTFSSQSVLDGNKIIYIQNTDIFSGRYGKDRYKEIKAFFGEIAEAIKRKVVVKKS
ncbi:MAG: DUF3857 and transglutaminase domain-containing protein [Prevotella sp.]|nr:DUF3857 and transglutaminase domain-containing protein [Prevotella sp.]